VKKILAAALLSTVVATPVFAADSGGYNYIGVSVGHTKTENPYTGLGTMTKDTDTAAGSLFGGYQFTKNWGLELFYTSAGKLEFSTGSNISGTAYGFRAVGTLPINDAFSVYGKFGYADVKTDCNSCAVTGDKHNTVTGGLGGQYNVNKEVGITLGWDQYELSTGGGAAKPKTNIVSIGALYKF